MNEDKSNNQIIIIGAGLAGLAAGIYARMNGYDARVFEMHTLPGGLCTSWERKGYTFDCCVHWLVGSNEKSGLHDMWEDMGVARDRKFTDHDEYMRIRGTDGRTLILHTNVDMIESTLLKFAPGDEKAIRKFIRGIRILIPFDTPSRHDSLFRKLCKQARMIYTFIRHGKTLKYWMNTTCGDFADTIKDPLLSEAFREMWVPDFSMVFVLFTLAYMHNRNAGYPEGGSMPLAKAMEKRFLDLGGTVIYKSRVTAVISENGVAKGIRLEDGSEHFAGRIISAADGHATLFDMLDGHFGDAATFMPYEKWPLFPSLIFVSLGIRRKFDDIPHTVSGITYMLPEPVMIGDRLRDKLSIRFINHDPSMAPEGCTTLTVMFGSDHEYWKELAIDRSKYLAGKEEVKNRVITELEKLFPGISGQVEAVDIATPVTFIRYTGNWKGSFEGWLITPENAGILMKPMPQTIPGLSGFYMCGQWVEPGGGLPTAVMSGRRLIRSICREDRRKFSS